MTFDDHAEQDDPIRGILPSVDDPDLGGLESGEGWLCASSLPIGAGGPGTGSYVAMRALANRRDGRSYAA